MKASSVRSPTPPSNPTPRPKPPPPMRESKGDEASASRCSASHYYILAILAWRVLILPEAREELRAVPIADRMAIENAIEKLTVLGDQLGAPHSSAIRGAGETLRELRPRGGRSR